jgi:hypothetical protein
MQGLKEALMTAAGFARRPVGPWAALAAAMVVIALAGVVRAHADPVDLQVVDRDTGRTLRLWRHDGRLFVAGEPGDRYSLRVTNHTDGRVLVVMSVDGVNILTGETASYDQQGYIFEAHQSYEVTGWRKSTTQVAAFTFAPLPESYAARTGRPAEVGVIGMAVFNERVPVAISAYTGQPDDSDRGSSRAEDTATARRSENLAAPLPAPPSSAAQSAGLAARSGSGLVAKAEPRDERLGTAHGAREWSVVTMVDFERATSYPQFVRQIEYDTHDHLVASGVIPSWRPEQHQPRPFPSNSDDQGFVPDPPA